MRDALAAWGVAASAAPRPWPPIDPAARRDAHTADQRRAVLDAYHVPELVYPETEGSEVRVAGRCRLVVDTVDGSVLRIAFAERDAGGSSSLLDGGTRGIPRRRGGSGRRGPSDYGELERMLIDEGCTVTAARGSGHRKVRLPSGTTVQMSSTPSDHRGVRNEVALLRRMGLKLTKF